MLVESRSLRRVAASALMSMLYLSFGCLIVIRVAGAHDIPAWADKAGTFMLSGLTLFAPYGINKLSSIGK